MTESARYAQLLVPMLWVGMVAAISFLEAPIKFRVPGVTLVVGLGIGRLVFKALNFVEIILLVVLVAACVAARPDSTAFVLLALAAAVLAIQLAVVRPPLSRRSERILAGENLPRSRVHTVYIALELAKVVLLVSLAATLVGGALQ